jgi:hypothetical protein
MRFENSQEPFKLIIIFDFLQVSPVRGAGLSKSQKSPFSPTPDFKDTLMRGACQLD